MGIATTGSNIAAAAQLRGGHHIGRIQAGLLRSTKVQIAIVLAGGLILFYREDGLTPAKLVYLMVTGCVALNATAQYLHLRETATGRSAMLLVLTALALLGLLGISYLVAAGNGGALSDWLRDSS